MTTDRARLVQELLPCPPLPASKLHTPADYGYYHESEVYAYARTYARACVAAAIEGAGVEVERLRQGIVERDDDYIVPGPLFDEINSSAAEWKARAERLAEALTGCRTVFDLLRTNRHGTKHDYVTGASGSMVNIDAAVTGIEQALAAQPPALAASSADGEGA